MHIHTYCEYNTKLHTYIHTYTNNKLTEDADQVYNYY